MEGSDKKLKNTYSSTLLLCHFLGVFGIHRIKSGKKISGYFMLSSFLVPFVVGLFVCMIYGSSNFFIEDYQQFLFRVFFALFPITIVIPVWAALDTITILIGKFKDENTGEYIKSKEKFSSTFTNYLVILGIIVNVIILYIIFIMYTQYGVPNYRYE